jgi:cellulose synthase/poly-beta-1,6-N-acetylglucosamine synthase-like glycosyltransferase
MNGNSAARCRNDIIRLAIKEKLDYVLFLDDDHVFPPDTLLRLLNRGVPFVSALYTWRVQPFHPNVFDQIDTTAKMTIIPFAKLQPGLLECNICGSGFFLAKVAELEKVPEPWFTLGAPFNEEWCDDISFCMRIRGMGYKIYVDLCAPISHIGTVLVTPEFNQKENNWQTVFSVDGLEVGRANHAYLESREKVVDE